MARPLSTIAPGWWDYTTLPKDLLAEVARLTADDIQKLSRDGFRVVFFDDLREFFSSRRPWSTSKPGVRRRRTSRWASAGRSDLRSNCRWSPSWSTRWTSTCAMPTSGAWTSGT